MTSYKDDNVENRTFFNNNTETSSATNNDNVKRALHYSAGKSGVDQIPPDVMMELGDVYKYGEQKYARDNWMSGTDWHEFVGSILRHLYRWMDGEEIDPESNCPHLAHLAWNAVTLRYYEKHNIGKDDRISTIRAERENNN